MLYDRYILITSYILASYHISIMKMDMHNFYVWHVSYITNHEATNLFSNPCDSPSLHTSAPGPWHPRSWAKKSSCLSAGGSTKTIYNTFKYRQNHTNTVKYLCVLAYCFFCSWVCNWKSSKEDTFVHITTLRIQFRAKSPTLERVESRKKQYWPKQCRWTMSKPLDNRK